MGGKGGDSCGEADRCKGREGAAAGEGVVTVRAVRAVCHGECEGGAVSRSSQEPSVKQKVALNATMVVFCIFGLRSCERYVILAPERVADREGIAGIDTQPLARWEPNDQGAVVVEVFGETFELLVWEKDRLAEGLAAGAKLFSQG